MIRSPLLVLALLSFSMGVSLHAQRDLSHFDPQDVRAATLELFDSLAASPAAFGVLNPYLGSFDREAFRNDSPALDVLATALADDEAPSMKRLDQTQPVSTPVLADGMLRVYRLMNHAEHPALQLEAQNPVSLAVFYLLVDRLDGVLDGSLDAPNLEGYYALWVEQSVPPAALCFGCRLDESWADRRQLINSQGLGRMLPRKLQRRLAGNAPERTKVTELARFVRQQVVFEDEFYNEDFWQTPFETLSSGSGDAEDLAILFQAVAEHYGLATKMIVGNLTGSDDSLSVVRNHAWVAFQGEVIDLTSFEGKHANARYEPKLVLDSKNSWFLTAQR